MSEQVWDFAAIHGAITDLRTLEGKVKLQEDDLTAMTGEGRALWTGDASEQWGIEQGNLNARYNTFFVALNDYIGSVEEATLQMQACNARAAASFC